MLIGSIASCSKANGGDDRFIGDWGGVLVAGPAELRLLLTVERDSAGSMLGSLTSIDQGNANIAGHLTISGDTLDLMLPTKFASYRATLAGDSLKGVFTQFGHEMPLLLIRGHLTPTLNRPQESKPPYPYRTDQVTITSKDGVRLSGTLSVPSGAGPFPVAVLITGSGPQDRDETVMGHKPFLVLADYLARHGIATLRYDDRGVAKSTGSFQEGTSLDFADDAEAAVKFLKGYSAAPLGKIGLIGHSEGGMIAPMVANRSNDVQFVVLLAGPGQPGDSILLEQQQLLSTARGTPPKMRQLIHDVNAKMFAAVEKAQDIRKASQIYDSLASEMRSTAPKEQQPAIAHELQSGKATLVNPWMLYFLRYDPRPALRELHVPLLALNGSLDLQVPAAQNLAGIEEALKQGHNPDYKVTELPGLNHLFQTAKTGSVDEYAQIEETFAPQALELIANWINAHK